MHISSNSLNYVIPNHSYLHYAHLLIYRLLFQINLDNLDTEIHKFMKSINITYFEDWVNENAQLDAWVNSDDFKDKIKLLKANGLVAQANYIESEITKTCLTPEERREQKANIPLVKDAFANYVNELLLEYLNKPMTRIRYHFLIYRRIGGIGDKTLVPAIFNIKQLEPKYAPLLERVQDLIQTRIPQIFGILEGSQHGLDRYKLFHSYVKYGDFFYITTEYLHTMSNFTHYAYLYENSMELEELIYSLSSSIVPNFWQSLRIDYQLKTFRIAKPATLMNKPSSGVARGANSRTSSRSSNKHTRIASNTTPVPLKGTPLKGTIMMIYEKSYQEYTVIYKESDSDSGVGEFKVLELKSNLVSCKNDIINEIGKKKPTSVNCVIEYSGRLFKVVSHSPFEKNIMRIIKRNNPLIVTVMKKPNTESRDISLKDMIKTELLDNTLLTNMSVLGNTEIIKDVQVINVALYKPILYFNCYMNIEYLTALLNYTQTGKRNVPRINFKDIGQFSEKYGVYGNSNTIINPSNCGYNIVEVGDQNRKVIWILPFSIENEYLRNFTSITIKHMPLLEAIKTLYIDKDHLCFLHIQSTHIYGTLHFHITRYDDYNLRSYPLEYQGSSIIKEININQIINYISQQSDYYSNYSSNLLNLTI